MKLSLTCLRSTARSRHAALIASYNAERHAFFDLRRPQLRRIERRLAQTEAKGAQPLWDGYAALTDYPGNTGPGATRLPSQVRTAKGVCRFYLWLSHCIAAQNVVEIGSAFGASGMYWLAGLAERPSAHLYTFEPNPVWASIARQNLGAVGERFTLTQGPFEDNLNAVPQGVDIALIDAIHTERFVTRHLDLLRPLCRPGALIIIDDIGFSPDMQACWQRISADPSHAAVWQIGKRTGIVEL